MTTFPTKDYPVTKYKYKSLVFYVPLDSLVTERETYCVLEWMGDLEGLFDALSYFGVFIVSPFASYQLKSELLSSIFNN